MGESVSSKVAVCLSPHRTERPNRVEGRSRARYVDFLLSVPVGMMSGIKGVTESEIYQSNETVQNFQHADEVLNQMLEGSTSIGMEYGPRAEAGLLTSQRVIEEMFQDIVMNDTPVEEAAKAAEDKLNDLFSTLG